MRSSTSMFMLMFLLGNLWSGYRVPNRTLLAVFNNLYQQCFFCSFFTAVFHICISITPLQLAPYCTYLLELVTGTILKFILVHLLFTVCLKNLLKKKQFISASYSATDRIAGAVLESDGRYGSLIPKECRVPSIFVQ